MPKIVTIIIAVSFIISSWILNLGLREFRAADRFISARGFSEKSVRADMAAWNIQFTSRGNNLLAATANYQRDRKELQAFLLTAGLKEEELFSGSPRVEQAFGSKGESGGFTIQGGIQIRTNEIEKVSKLVEQSGEILAKGIALSGWDSSPRYYFTSLSAIKPDMVAKALTDARQVAERFAKDSGSNIRDLKQATQGLFSVRGAIEEMPEGAQIDKIVRVVVNLEYRID